MQKNYINSEWIDSLGKEKVEIINPATGKVIDHCPLGTKEDVNRAVEAAAKAFPMWRQTPPTDRVQPLFRLKMLLEENQEALARCLTQEHGKTLVEARGSIRRGIQMVETACGIPTLMMGQVLEDIAPGIDSQAVRRPMGVFTAITPSNFPAMVPFWFWPFAVASGNTFVLKPSERVPMTQTMIMDLITKAKFPPGVINVVQGGREVVDALCTHPKIQGVSFVGSTPVAKHVYVTASAAGKRVQSLGGAKNFMVVMPDAVMDKAVSTALESIIGCAGQRCLAGSVILAVGDCYDKVADQIVRFARDVNVGDGLDPRTQMGPVISAASKERVKGLIAGAVKEGGKLLLDGRENVDQMPGYFLRPSVIGEVKPEMTIAKEEVFGPVVCLARVKTLDEAITWLNSSNYANTTTLFTTNGAAARKFTYEVEPSMIGINIGVPAPMSFFSFGGAKDSFFGDVKAHGRASMDFYTDTKTTIFRWLSDSSIWSK
ncbi:MAG: CoA-acylating methylmalonate-semialdehyde dehydrogenase [Bacteriovoracia bacterium]